RRALCLWPPDGSSPIEAFVAWPSGTLAFATLGLLLPLSEELFFRGFVYHAVERLAGAWPAALLSTLAFVLLHLQQVWGNWGALVGIVLLSCACSLLRLVSGHWSVAAVAHLSYNGWLVWRSMA
ncbi:MAG: lysostaphin resistance A-like protein, partial [Polyangiales bacterium]